MSDFTAIALLLGAFVVVVMFYFFPSMVADRRGHRNRKAILVLNLFAGWSGFFWIICLVWACTSNTESAAQEQARAIALAMRDASLGRQS